MKWTGLKNLIIFSLICATTLLCESAIAGKPNVCEGQFALCTTAKCSPIAGQKGLALCHCSVQNAYSAGYKSCQKVTSTTADFQLIQSRYYPIQSYVTCSNDHAWANCLDSPCVVDSNDPTRALCTCPIVQNKGDYVIVSDSCDKSGCDSGLYSSALVTDSKKMADYLTDQKNLPNISPIACKQ